MAADEWRDEKGRLKKGAPPLYKGKPPPPPSDTDDTDFDAVLIASASSFGTNPKAKTGLAGYCVSLRDSRPVEYAQLLKAALARKQTAIDSAIAAVPITVEFITAPTGYFLPYEEARALWAARTGERPVLVIDNATPSTFEDTPDEGDPDDAADPD